jgi:hypothetical protein
MNPLVFEDGAIQIDATIVADGLGIALPLLLERMRAGKITSLSEEGIDADKGRYRLTFFSENRRFRLVVDEGGSIIQRSTLDYGKLRCHRTSRADEFMADPMARPVSPIRHQAPRPEPDSAAEPVHELTS